jgi:hypothetical protein
MDENALYSILTGRPFLASLQDSCGSSHPSHAQQDTTSSPFSTRVPHIGPCLAHARLSLALCRRSVRGHACSTAHARLRRGSGCGVVAFHIHNAASALRAMDSHIISPEFFVQAGGASVAAHTPRRGAPQPSTRRSSQPVGARAGARFVHIAHASSLRVRAEQSVAGM